MQHPSQHAQIVNYMVRRVHVLGRAGGSTCELSRTLQSETVLSREPETRRWPSRDQARQVTDCVWGWQVRAAPRVSVSQMTTSPLSHPAAGTMLSQCSSTTSMQGLVRPAAPTGTDQLPGNGLPVWAVRKR